MLELVVLQCDQRRDDDRRPVAQQTRELVDRRLTATGLQNGKNVASASRCGNSAYLPGSEVVEAEGGPSELASLLVAHSRMVKLGQTPPFVFRQMTAIPAPTWREMYDHLSCCCAEGAARDDVPPARRLPCRLRCSQMTLPVSMLPLG